MTKSLFSFTVYISFPATLNLNPWPNRWAAFPSRQFTWNWLEQHSFHGENIWHAFNAKS